ncbi:recombinase family protein [Cellulosilyticum sp. I15G10I2]|uniref:recombinase family protein n=1 Tax=Cellulosilyticum sp. I15G10I2 TaxID=1892843 RepID=UPI00085CA242|nr:recombinase family protein [Cellulosilyticum sp. I15G10I2]
MKIAIYARKSRTTDKGESIENQISLCRQYAAVHFQDAIFDEYKDEGYSGGNTNRPAFKELLQSFKKEHYDVLICYRLDRISRNVLDFSSTLDMLSKNNIAFVSIKENFDTTTPMGRAMLHISSVFAQLERETIAERIRDNMLELSKTGRWLGGTTPLGYTSKKVAYDVKNSKTKYYTILKADEMEASIVKLIFKKYLELGSLSQLETHLIQKDIRTLNNKFYHPHVLKNILANPVYVVADQSIYDYFYDRDAYIAHPKSDFTGDYAPMVYNKNRQGKIIYKNNISEWIVALGQHRPLISSTLWLQVQKQLNTNRRKAIPHHQSSHALLTGLIHCGHCGAPMKVTNQSVLKDGSISYIYRCTTKLKSHGKLCNMPNAKGHHLDPAVIEKVKQLLPDNNQLIQGLAKERLTTASAQQEDDKNIIIMEGALQQNEKAISKLVRLIASCEDSLLERSYHKEIDRLHKEQMVLEEKLWGLQNTKLENSKLIENTDKIIDILRDFDRRINEASINEKRILLQSIIHSVVWDGHKINVYLYRSEQDYENNNHNYPHGCKITYEKW